MIYISEKTNTKANVLSRKDQVDTTDDNRNVKLLKDKLWIRQMKTKVEVVIIRKSQVIEKTTLLGEIQRNQTKKQKIQRELEKNDGIVYAEGRIYISNNRKI